MASKYREQYDRMKRWLDRFEILDTGRQHNVSSDNYIDEIYAFFMNCYHLKDWLKQDVSVPETIQQCVENHINQNRALTLCADLCNSLKHLVLSSRRKSDEDPTFGKKGFSLELGAGPAMIALKYQVETTGEPIDAFQLASDCVDAWDDFLKKHNLI